MLEKLKDIFYDKNDIIVALMILIAAGVIITHQVESIMSYPQLLAAQVQQAQNEEESIKAQSETEGSQDAQGEGSGDEAQRDETQRDDDQSQSAQPQSNSGEFKTSVSRTVVIPTGSHSTSIASILVNAGLVPSQDAFLSAVSAAKAETKLKAGSFTIPAGSTLSDVVSILTK